VIRWYWRHFRTNGANGNSSQKPLKHPSTTIHKLVNSDDRSPATDRGDCAGNHGVAVALAARRHGLAAMVVLPADAVRTKIAEVAGARGGAGRTEACLLWVQARQGADREPDRSRSHRESAAGQGTRGSVPPQRHPVSPTSLLLSARRLTLHPSRFSAKMSARCARRPARWLGRPSGFSLVCRPGSLTDLSFLGDRPRVWR